MLASLLAATDGADILRIVATATWADAHPDGAADAPTPTAADLAVNLAVLPGPDANAILSALFAPLECHWRRLVVDGADTLVVMIGALAGEDDPVPVVMTVEEVHRFWSEDVRRPPRHPLAPLVAAWQRLPSARQPFAPAKRASLPRLAKIRAARLPDFAPGAPPPPADGQLTLPGFGAAIAGCPSWLLWLFDAAGGESLSSGRGAPWDLRLFVYALLHLNVADRDGEWHTIRLPTETVIGWLHPNGWANARRDWDRLPAALDRMRQALTYLPIPGIGRVAMLFPSVIPERDGPLVEFTARVPTAAAHGDRLNWPRLLSYGADSARLFRAYLAVTAYLGRSAKGGHPQTRTIAAPVLGPDGKPARRKGGAIIRSTTERTLNPSARFIGPPLSEEDLTRMIGFDPTDKRRRHDARAAFERMEADGVIEVDRDGEGWRLFGGPNW